MTLRGVLHLQDIAIEKYKTELQSSAAGGLTGAITSQFGGKK